MHDLVIRGGHRRRRHRRARRAPPTSRSTAASITAGRTRRRPRGAREIDADGLARHARASSTCTRTTTAQVTWDPHARAVVLARRHHASSSATAASASRRCAPSDASGSSSCMEGVEDIPGAALAEGHHVGLGDVPRVPRRARPDAARDRHRHARAARGGARLRDGRTRRATRPPTTDDIAAMAAIVRGGDRRRRARLLDFAHRSATAALDGGRCPARSRARTSAVAIRRAMADPATVFERVPAGGGRAAGLGRTDGAPRRRAGVDGAPGSTKDAPAHYVSRHGVADPDAGGRGHAARRAKANDGARLFPQIAARPGGPAGPLESRSNPFCSTAARRT